MAKDFFKENIFRELNIQVKRIYSIITLQADVDMATQPDGQTALHLAAEESKVDCTMLQVNYNLKFTL